MVLGCEFSQETTPRPVFVARRTKDAFVGADSTATLESRCLEDLARTVVAVSETDDVPGELVILFRGQLQLFRNIVGL